jgi:hypothetical protein
VPPWVSPPKTTTRRCPSGRRGETWRTAQEGATLQD